MMQRDRGARRVAALVALRRIGANDGLRLVLDGQDAVAHRQQVLNGDVHDGARTLARDDLEMIGLAANDAAERDRPGVSAAFGQHADGGGNFERAGHVDDIPFRADGFQGARRARQQHVANAIVIARLDDEEFRAIDGRQGFEVSARFGHRTSRIGDGPVQ